MPLRRLMARTARMARAPGRPRVSGRRANIPVVSRRERGKNRPVKARLFSSMTPRRWIEYTVAILAGNAVYFLVLFPDFPPGLQHQPMKIDFGLVLDFLCCVAVYAVIRLGATHARRWRA